MSDEMIALARRADACRGWRWMPGMRWWTDDDRGRLDDYQPEYMGRPTDALPDLTDAATLGCLLALVREAWRCPKANVSWVTDDKCMVVFYMGHAQEFLLADTEAEALVAALESAP
jgi:hypothetical protein